MCLGLTRLANLYLLTMVLNSDRVLCGPRLNVSGVLYVCLVAL